MRSKTLSKADRDAILSNVRKKAQKKWEASPLHKEMQSLESAASKIIGKVQLKLVPEADRIVLNRYGSRAVRTLLQFAMKIDKTSPSTCFGKSCVKMYFMQYDIRGLAPKGYPERESDFITLIHKKNPELLPRFAELWHLHKCEEDNIVIAFKKLLSSCNTTKQAANIPEILPFIPDRLLNLPAKIIDQKLTKEDSVLVAELNS